MMSDDYLENTTDFASSTFASADFPDANEISPSNFIVCSDNSYSSAINNAMDKHLNEVKEKTNTNIVIQKSWKKRFREFITTKNSKLLEFLTLKLKLHPVLGPIENFFQKFGKSSINSQQSLKEIILDSSGVDITQEIDALCLSNDFESTQKYVEQTTYLMEQYKLVADKILDQENLLKIKMATLDNLQQKISGIQSLTHNEHYEELMTVTEKYINKIFEENNIENDYNSIIELYRRFYHLRELVKSIRNIELTEKEPLCSICFNEQIQYAIIPCGHTFCTTCIKRHIVNCSVCRGQIRDRVRIYFT
jgi:ATP-dependent Lon protease